MVLIRAMSIIPCSTLRALLAGTSPSSPTTSDSRHAQPPVPHGPPEMADDAAALIAAPGYDRAHVFGTSSGRDRRCWPAHPQRIDRWCCRVPAPRAAASIKPDVFPGSPPGLPGTAAEIATTLSGRAHAAHPEVVDIFNGTSRTAEQTASRRHSRKRSPRSRGDHGADAGWSAPTTGSSRRRTRSLAREIATHGPRSAGPRPCRHLAGARRGGARHRLPENKSGGNDHDAGRDFSGVVVNRGGARLA